MRVCARAMPAPTAPTAPKTEQLPPLYLGNPYLNPHLRSFQDELLDAARKDGGGGGGGGGVSVAELKALQEANDAEHAAMQQRMGELDSKLMNYIGNQNGARFAKEGKEKELMAEVKKATSDIGLLRERYDKEVKVFLEKWAQNQRLDNAYKFEELERLEQQYQTDRAALEKKVTELETTVETLIAEIQEARQQDEDDATAKLEALAEKADDVAFRNELRAELDAKLAEEKAEDLKEREAMEAKFEQKLAALRGELEGRLEAPDELVALVKNALEEDLNDRDYHAYEEFTAGDEKVKAQLSGKIKEVREEAKAAAAANAAAAQAAAEAAAEASTLAQLAGGVDDDDPERSTSFEPGPARQQSADL